MEEQLPQNELDTAERPDTGASIDAGLAETFTDEGSGENDPYKGMLWIKEKFEEYRLQSDERMGALRVELDRRVATIEVLNEELVQAREKIADLSTKLEKNMSLLMNIHKELDKSLVADTPATIVADPSSTTPEAAIGGSGNHTENV